MRNFLISFCFALPLLNVTQGTAQSLLGETNAQQQISTASQWLEAQRYQAVADMVGVLKDHSDQEISKKASELSVLAAIGLEDPQAIALATDFVKAYPTALGAHQIYFKAGSSFFSVGQYSKAMPWLQKVSAKGLSTNEQQQYYFYYGYCKLIRKEYKGALLLFENISENNAYAKAVAYYKGYIAYANGNYKKAKALFSADFSGFKADKIAYFLADIYFREGNFEAAIQAALAYLPKANRTEASELNKVVGASYFSLKAYEKAIPYLTAYRGIRRVWKAEDYYQLGYSYYSTGQTKAAIGQFNKILRKDTDLVQHAYYLLGASYLKEDQKPAALNAFKSAAQLYYNPAIQKEARFNYAQLSYEVGTLNRSLETVFNEFISNHPSDPRAATLSDLLLDAVLASGDYQAALDLLAKQNDAPIASSQSIGLEAGLLALNDKKYALAATYFEDLIALDTSTAAAMEALFWQSELALRQYDYPAAFAKMEAIKRPTLLPKRLRSLLSYQKGYAFFKTQEYLKSIAAFDQFLSVAQGAESLALEIRQALLRKADALYSSGQFSKAVGVYSEIESTYPKSGPYAAFNKAMALGLRGGLTEKIQVLEQFLSRYPKHAYTPKVYMELAAAQASKEQTDLAIGYYDRIVKEYPKSELLPQSLLKKGLLYFNQSKAAEALRAFQELAAGFPKSDAFPQAVQAAKRIYIEEGRLKDYRKWSASFDIPAESEASLEAQTFDQMSRRVAGMSVTDKMTRYERYLNDFPNGANHLQVRFDLAQLYTQTAAHEKALALYTVVAQARSIHQEASLLALAKIQLENGLGAAPEPILEQLLDITQDPFNRAYALSNLMRLSYEDEALEQALRYAHQVLALSEIPIEIKQDAQIMLARGAQSKGDKAAAETAYSSLRETASGALVAESIYWLAYYKNEAGAYEASNELVLELAQDFGAYKIWAAKGLLLMGDNFLALEDHFQAQYLWQNVLENFAQFPDLIRAAEIKIEQLEALKLNDPSDV